MLPEILDSIEDLVDSLTPLFALIVLTIGTYFTVRVWRGSSKSRVS